MTITIKIDNLSVEVQVTHYLPAEPPRGPYGYGFAAELVWVGPDWLDAVADHFNLWGEIDELVLDAIAECRKESSNE